MGIPPDPRYAGAFRLSLIPTLPPPPLFLTFLPLRSYVQNYFYESCCCSSLIHVHCLRCKLRYFSCSIAIWFVEVQILTNATHGTTGNHSIASWFLPSDIQLGEAYWILALTPDSCEICFQHSSSWVVSINYFLHLYVNFHKPVVNNWCGSGQCYKSAVIYSISCH